MLKIDQLDLETRQRILAMLQEQGVPVAGPPAAPENKVSPAPAGRSRRRWVRAIAWLAVLVVSVAFACQALATYSRYEKVRIAALNDAPAINDGVPLRVSPEEEAYLKENGLVPWEWENGTSLKGKQGDQQVNSGAGTTDTTDTEAAKGAQEGQPLDWRNTGVDWAALEKRLEPYVFRITNPSGGAGTAFYTGDNWRHYRELQSSGNWAGSGTAASNVYTAYHVVKGSLQGGKVEAKFRLDQINGGRSFFDEAYWYGANSEVGERNDFVELTTGWDNSGFVGGAKDDWFNNAPLFGNAYTLEPGDLVLILGNPRNLWDAGSHPGPVSTVGRVLAVDVSFKEQGMWNSIKHGLKIQADIAPGNSGSPVFNSRGEVVGMVVAGGLPEPDPESGVNRIAAYAVMFPLR